MTAYSKGLEGVVVGETAISNVEGESGRLTYRGYDIEVLVKHRFEEVVRLLVFGELPNEKQLQELSAFLAPEAADGSPPVIGRQRRRVHRHGLSGPD